jgi:hypothetical protein
MIFNLAIFAQWTLKSLNFPLKFMFVAPRWVLNELWFLFWGTSIMIMKFLTLILHSFISWVLGICPLKWAYEKVSNPIWRGSPDWPKSYMTSVNISVNISVFTCLFMHNTDRSHIHISTWLLSMILHFHTCL